MRATRKIRWRRQILCFVDRASMYNLINSNNSSIYVRILLRCYHMSVSNSSFHGIRLSNFKYSLVSE